MRRVNDRGGVREEANDVVGWSGWLHHLIKIQAVLSVQQMVTRVIFKTCAVARGCILFNVIFNIYLECNS